MATDLETLCERYNLPPEALGQIEALLAAGARFEDLGLLGRGGMGEVRRVTPG